MNALRNRFFLKDGNTKKNPGLSLGSKENGQANYINYEN